MEDVRLSSLENRKKIYLNDRIDEQRKWYADKSGYNKRQSKKFFIFLVVLQVAAIGLVLTRIAYPAWQYWPTDVFVVMAGESTRSGLRGKILRHNKSLHLTAIPLRFIAAGELNR